MSTAIVYYSMLGNSGNGAEKAFDRIKKMIGIEKAVGFLCLKETGKATVELAVKMVKHILLRKVKLLAYHKKL